jgi:membrane fusion protein (multidrug efflux system)
MSILSYVAAVGLSPAGVARRPALRKTALGLVLLAGLGVGARHGYDYWTVGRFLQSTDNAYIRADHTTVAPLVAGYVTEVLVHDNQTVAAGQVLARIDDRDLRIALEQATANVATAEATLLNLDAQIAQQLSVVDQEKADIAADKAALALAEADNARYADLRKSGYGSVQRAQQAEAALSAHKAGLRKSRAGVLIAQRKIDVLQSEWVKAEAQRDHSQAVQRQAQLRLSATSISAPIGGTVGARTVRVGQYVQAGTPLMAIVPLNSVYVVANYKETQLARVRAGQPVEITVDSFPGVTLKGHVDSLSPASGLEFALLPSDKATGNFTKIVQRVPVRIAFDDAVLVGQLRPGMSVAATIDTRP